MGGGSIEFILTIVIGCFSDIVVAQRYLNQEDRTFFFGRSDSTRSDAGDDCSSVDDDDSEADEERLALLVPALSPEVGRNSIDRTVISTRLVSSPSSMSERGLSRGKVPFAILDSFRYTHPQSFRRHLLCKNGMLERLPPC